MQVTMAVFLGEEFGFSQFAISGVYATPIVSPLKALTPQRMTDAKIAVVSGELVGRYTNDWIMNVSIRRNNGVFEAESRLWYVQLPLSDFFYLDIGLATSQCLYTSAVSCSSEPPFKK